MRLRQREPRLKLNSEAYAAVRKHVLERDGWRCQDCGAVRDLQVHHMKPRSQLGGDMTQNLITLCAYCHRKRHVRCRHKPLSKVPVEIIGKQVHPTQAVNGSTRVPARDQAFKDSLRRASAGDGVGSSMAGAWFEWISYQNTCRGREFNPYDLYSKPKDRPNVEQLRPYYEDLIAKYFPAKLNW